MSWNWELGLAWQYLRPKRRRGFINLIGMISVLGTAVSVAGVIVVVSVMNGFSRDIRDRIIGTNSHVMVRAYTKEGIPRWRELMTKIKGMPQVAAAAPYYQGQAMLKSRAGVTGVLLHGILPGEHSRVAKLKENLREGSLKFLEIQQATSASSEEAILPVDALLGIELRANLDVGMGEEVTLFSPVFRNTAVGLMPRMAKVKVAGIFQTGYYEFDSSLIYTSLADAQRLFDAPDVVNQIGIRVNDLSQATAVADAIQAMDNGVSFWASDWQKQNLNLFKALQLEKRIMFLILGVMILVSAVNIISTLVMVVMEKQKEIGVLRALGASGSSVARIFLAEGVLIGGLGTGLGFVLGLGVCAFIKIFPIHIPGGGSVYYIETLPVDIQRNDLMIVAVTALLTCLLAALYPARSASRLDPVEAIRYE